MEWPKEEDKQDKRQTMQWPKEKEEEDKQDKRQAMNWPKEEDKQDKWQAIQKTQERGGQTRQTTDNTMT